MAELRWGGEHTPSRRPVIRVYCATDGREIGRFKRHGKKPFRHSFPIYDARSGEQVGFKHASPEPATWRCYNWGCKAPECKEQSKLFAKRYREGRYKLQPVDIVRDHVRKLNRPPWGLSMAQIDKGSGVHHRVLTQIANGNQKRVTLAVGRRILAYRPEPGNPPGQAYVPIEPLRRMLGAAVATGRSTEEVGRGAFGMGSERFWAFFIPTQKYVQYRHQLQAAAYLREIGPRLLPPSPRHGTKGHKCYRPCPAYWQEYARKRGWKPPAFWDSAWDRPSKLPEEVKRPVAPSGHRMRDPSVIERVRELALQGWNDIEIAAEINKSREAVCKLRERNRIPSGYTIARRRSA